MWSRILISLQNFFAVSPKEGRGIVVLLLISVVCLLFPMFLKQFLLYRSPEERDLERRQIDSIVTALLASKEMGGRMEVVNAPVQITEEAFDPNLASEDEFQAAGIPAALAKRMVNYRQKGGVFRKKEDLKRIYGFSEELYERLESFITIKERSPSSQGFSAGRNEDGRVNTRDLSFNQGRKDFVRPEQVIVPFDINKADTIQLMKLKGIGSSRARTIIRYRDALGGFYSDNQFQEIFNLDSIALSQLQRYARIMSAPKKIKVNEVSEEDLLKHPYARKSSRSARAIVRYREQHGPYHSLDQLYEIVSVDSAFLDMLKPYLQL